ncbi:tetratricopeptide repeat protein [Aurantimonas sp. Leaf443]|uniref:tetratricopeptide repeat protein n=1 Tax=Aurantimonas sp. Leaf443 TaxID=1736378 RepID=UPI0006FB090E|nr:tetratricopeptide repeat protein [Aurantimonas sp. Leaf443]KQT82189.1 hypothetical protein ASG48_16250 [Aurantimonas sp. Leaf443]
MGRVLPCVLVLAALGAALAAGPDAFGRLALKAGLPTLAAGLLSGDEARGVALYRAGDYAGADAAFTAAGRTATYNRGNSLAALGDYKLAASYYDAAIFAEPTDADARFNRALVGQFLEPITGEANDIDGLAATAPAEQSEARPSERPDIAKTKTLAEQERVQRPRTGQAVVASEDWLTTLPDDPGRYLKARLKAEHDARVEAGLTHPPEDTAW